MKEDGSYISLHFLYCISHLHIYFSIFTAIVQIVIKFKKIRLRIMNLWLSSNSEQSQHYTLVNTGNCFCTIYKLQIHEAL